MAVPDRLSAALTGRYEIEREIGAGGMAVVYAARDLRHSRRVALKVLRPELGAILGAERFLSEIRVTANMQHPNLVPLFESGEADGQLFYAMPLVEGESLRRRLDREKQLPVEVALHIATAMASALDYAHRRGVIHRDLKPENILLHDGEPMIADFGIALAVSNAGGSRITQTGLSLGTPQYMAPEQATGDREVGAGADIYSLAAVTYEMLAGEPPHTGKTSQAVIARLLTERPRDLRIARPSVPEYAEQAVMKGLASLPADRFATAREFADAVTGKTPVVTNPISRGRVVAQPAAGLRGRATRVALIASLLLWVATVAGGALLLAPGAAPPEMRFTVETPPPSLSFGLAPLRITISPDGRFLAFVAEAMSGESPTIAEQTSGASPIIWVRELGQTTPRALPGTNGAEGLFWSPDSRWIGYWDGRRLAKIDVTGGAPQTIVQLPQLAFLGGTWNKDGVIVFESGGTLHRISAEGGTPTELTSLIPEQTSLRYPVFLPDDEHFLYLAWTAVPGERAIYAGSLNGAEAVFVTRAESRVAYAPDGLLLYHRQGTLLAQRFDEASLSLSGEPFRVADGIRYSQSNGDAAFTASQNGVLAFRTGITAGATQLQWFNRRGEQVRVGEQGFYRQLSLSPDGKYVALERSAADQPDVWVLDLATDIMSRVTFDGTSNDAVWFPDSRSVAFVSRRRGITDFYRTALGGGAVTPLLESAQTKYLNAVSKDGCFVLYHLGRTTLAALPIHNDSGPVVLTDSLHARDEARFSPDGKWISYGSNESGRWEVYLASFPALQNRRQISANGGVQARWRADGGELYYLAPDGTIMAVTVSLGTPSEISVPRPLFRSPLSTPAGGIDQFDVTADGQNFLVLVSQRRETHDHITVVVNWAGAP